MRIHSLAFIVSLVPIVGTLHADVPASQRDEVAYLLRFVDETDCTMIRNGRRHDGSEAVEHIRNKYDYFRERIDSTEAFIEYAASRSTLSGRDYWVECPGEAPRKTSDWLLKALSDYRQRAR